MDSARLVRWGWLVAGLLVMGCDFTPGIEDHSDAGVYPTCTRDLDCLESCVCLGGSVCVPIVKGETCTPECDTDADCVAGAQNASVICSRGVCKLEGCTPPYLDCDGLAATGCESDPGNDEANCGGCAGAGGRACDTTIGEVCAQGSCFYDPCEAGWQDCDDDGDCESDPLTDASNCGGCIIDGGMDCFLLDNTENTTCHNGACQLTCLPFFGNCDGDPGTGCETDTLTSMTDCGGCAFEGGLPCDSVRLELCDQGECRVNSCEYEWHDCDQNMLNSCESDPMRDPLNCGACSVNGDHECVFGSEVCEGGVCSCAPGYALCDPEAPCTMLGTPVDCGGCGDDCTGLPRVDPFAVMCIEAQCVIGGCQPGFDDCNREPGDGCEAYLLDDIENCGGCQNACVTANVSSVICVLGECDYEGGCLDGFDDCDGDRRNGCEADLHSDTRNCLYCGNDCGNGQVCSTNGCDASSCDNGMAECVEGDDVPCETPLWTLADCSYCGDNCWLQSELLNCPPGQCYPMCSQGSGCFVAPCPAERLDCDGLIDEQGQACEILMSAEQCGSCTHDCWLDPEFWLQVNDSLTYPSCSRENGGQCAPATCDVLRAECDRDPAEVCETHLDWVTDCGYCGHSCAMYSNTQCALDGSCTIVCDSGACVPYPCPPGFVDCNFEDNVPCETQVVNGFDCQACAGHCPSGKTCLDGVCQPNNAVVCGGQTCLPNEVCCVSNDGSQNLSCQDPLQSDNCLLTLSCTSPADCPPDQACCQSAVGGMSAPVACHSPVQCAALGILCETSSDCTGDLGVMAYCCANPLLPGFSTCQLVPCNDGNGP